MLAYRSPASSSPAGSSPAGPSSPSLIASHHPVHPSSLGRPLVLPEHLASPTINSSASGSPHSFAGPSSRRGPSSLLQSFGGGGDRASFSAPPSRLPSPRMEPTTIAFPSPIPLHLNERLLGQSPAWKPYRQVPAGSPASLVVSGPTSRSESVVQQEGAGSGGIRRVGGKSGGASQATEARVRRCRNVGEAMSAFEAILMGDSTDSSGSSDDDEATGGGAGDEEEHDDFEMDEERGRGGSIVEEAEGLEEEGIAGEVKRRIVAEKYRRQPHRTVRVATSTSVSPVAPERKPRHAKPGVFRPMTIGSSGWSKGLATLSSHFSFVVDIPVWSPDSRTDLSSLLQIRDETLSALHHIIDGLRLRGVRATYRLMSISSVEEGGPGRGRAEDAPYGCIRIAPFLVPTVSKRLPMQPLSYNTTAANAAHPVASAVPVTPASLLSMRRSTIGPSKEPALGMGFSTSLHQPTSNFGRHLPPQELSTSGPSAGKAGWHDNEGGCGRLSALPGQETVDQGDEDKELIKREVQAAIERDRNGIAMEGRSFLLAIHGQPALIIT